MELSVYPAFLEYRQRGRTLAGRFNYGSVATLAARGTVRKESFAPRAFRFAIEDRDHEIDLLRGHSFDHPLASTAAGTLLLEETDAALEFRGILPPESAWPTWMADTVRAVRGGLARGISPGFRIPPASAVADAEELIPEPGNPSVQIRQINAAVLFELSIVTRPAYKDSEIDVRHEQLIDVSRAGLPELRPEVDRERYLRWL